MVLQKGSSFEISSDIYFENKNKEEITDSGLVLLIRGTHNKFFRGK